MGPAVLAKLLTGAITPEVVQTLEICGQKATIKLDNQKMQEKAQERVERCMVAAQMITSIGLDIVIWIA